MYVRFSDMRLRKKLRCGGLAALTLLSIFAVAPPQVVAGDSDGDGVDDEYEYNNRIYFERFRFESGAEGWSLGGLWDRTSARSASPTFSLRCGRVPTIPYSSELLSPWIKIPLVPLDKPEAVMFTFWFRLDGASIGEHGSLRIRTTQGGPWHLLKVFNYDVLEWRKLSFDMRSYAGQEVQFRFWYSSIDGNPLVPEGWFIDSVELSGYMNPNEPDTDGDGLDDDEVYDFSDVYDFSFENGSAGWKTIGDEIWEVTDEMSNSPRSSQHGVRHDSETRYGGILSPALTWPMSDVDVKLSYDYWMDGEPATLTVKAHIVNGERWYSTDPQVGDSLVKDVGDGPISLYVGELPSSSGVDNTRIVTANYNADSISIVGDSHEPTYDIPLDTRPGPIGPHSVTIGDALNFATRDHVIYNFIVTANKLADTVSVIECPPGQVCSEYAVLDVGYSPTSVFIGDFDNDGDNDIVTADWDSYEISVLPWIDLATEWGPRLSFVPWAAKPYSIFIGDSDNDGDNEIVTSHPDDDVVCFTEWSSGTLVLDTCHGVGDYPTSVFVSKVTDDGLNRVVVANTADNTVTIFRKTGSSCTTESVLAVGNSPESLFVADLQDDGDMDVVTANSIDNSVTILMWDLGGWWREDIFLNQDIVNARSVAVGDIYISMSPTNDIVVAGYLSDNTQTILRRTDYGFLASHTWWNTPQEVWNTNTIDFSTKHYFYPGQHIRLTLEFWAFQDGTVSGEGCYIDNVRISAAPNPLNPDTDNDDLADGLEAAVASSAHSFQFTLWSKSWRSSDRWTHEGDIGDGLWERSSLRYTSPIHSYHAGKHPSMSITSYLYSPPVKLPSSPELVVSFMHYFDAEPDLDLGSFDIHILGGSGWTNLGSFGRRPFDPPVSWEDFSVSITEFASETVVFRFLYYSYFDSTHEGWFVDDVEIIGSTSPLKADTDADALDDNDEAFASVHAGRTISPSGFYYDTSPIAWDTDRDGVRDSDDLVPLDWDMDADGLLNADDSDMDSDGVPNVDDNDDDNDGMDDLAEIERMDLGSWQDPYVHNRKYAVLVGFDSPDGGFNKVSWNGLVSLRSKLMSHGYEDDFVPGFEGYDPTEEAIAIMYHNEGDGSDGYSSITDVEESKENLIAVMDSVRRVSSLNDFVFFVYLGHSAKGGFYLKPKVLGYIDWDVLKDSFDLMNYSRMAVLFVSCWNGNAVHYKLGEVPPGTSTARISKVNRIVITSSDNDRRSWYDISGGYWPFVDGFRPGLGSDSLLHCFNDGKNEQSQWHQTEGKAEPNPQLEDNGDGLSQENTDSSYPDFYVPGYVYDDGDLAGSTYV